MDAFFASVEQRENPGLKGKPIAVGGAGGRGVVAAASYEARKFGVRSAMPSTTAARLCPGLIFVKPHFDLYKSVSRTIRDIFYSYTDLVEPLSLDEAYLDVTHNKQGIHSATQVARKIRQEIFEQTQLTASAGVSVNKFLAKVASDLNKPNGLTVILPEQAERFLEQLAIDKFHGIGKKTAEQMKKMGIFTGADLKAKTEWELASRFGKSGRHFYRMVRAIDNRPVEPDRLRKSVGAENTFSEDLTDPADMLEQLQYLTEKVAAHVQKGQTAGRTLTLKIKFHDFTQTTRSKTLPHWVSQTEQMMPVVEHLLNHPALPERPVRLLGVSLSNLDNSAEGEPLQLTFDF